MTAAHDYDDVHNLVDQLSPGQLGEVRAHMLRLAASRRRFVPWGEAREAASKLPPVDAASFRADVDAVVDQDSLLGDER